MQLIVTIVISATAVVFAALYLKEVWSRSTVEEELATLKEQQRNTNTGCCKDYFYDNYKPAKTTKTTR